MKKTLLCLLLCLALTLCACGKTEITPVTEPAASGEPAAAALTFETTDLAGNPVKSEELFAAHRLTMVNVWTTWCGYCLAEMPELQKLSETLAERDVAIVGLLYDGTTEDALAQGGDILAQTGVTYLNLLPWAGVDAQLGVQAFPTTFFVDSEGHLVGEPILGARLDAYEAQIEALLADMG